MGSEETRWSCKFDFPFYLYYFNSFPSSAFGVIFGASSSLDDGYSIGKGLKGVAIDTQEFLPRIPFSLLFLLSISLPHTVTLYIMTARCPVPHSKTVMNLLLK